MLVVKTTSPETSPSPAKVQPENAVPSSSTTNAWLRCASPRLRPCSKLRSHRIVYQLATYHRAHDPPLEPPPQERGVRGSAGKRLHPDSPLLGEVHERQIRRRSWRDSVGITRDPASRGTSHRLDQPR